MFIIHCFVTLFIYLFAKSQKQTDKQTIYRQTVYIYSTVIRPTQSHNSYLYSICTRMPILMAIFQVDLGVSWYQNVFILDFTAAKGDRGGGDNWSYKTCQSNRHHQQNNTHF